MATGIKSGAMAPRFFFVRRTIENGGQTDAAKSAVSDAPLPLGIATRERPK